MTCSLGIQLVWNHSWTRLSFRRSQGIVGKSSSSHTQCWWYRVRSCMHPIETSLCSELQEEPIGCQLGRCPKGRCPWLRVGTMHSCDKVAHLRSVRCRQLFVLRTQLGRKLLSMLVSWCPLMHWVTKVRNPGCFCHSLLYHMYRLCIGSSAPLESQSDRFQMNLHRLLAILLYLSKASYQSNKGPCTMSWC